MAVSTQPTRSFGLLEGMLAAKRAAVANRLIPDDLRSGRLLDLGCGTTPYFLNRARFAEKVGVDPAASPAACEAGIELVQTNIESPPLPFPSGHFSAITMLAVLEHLAPQRVPAVIEECHRLLKPEGVLVLTWPAPWTNGVLRLMAALRLVSRCEIEDHKGHYSRGSAKQLIEAAGFASDRLTSGHFEFGANLWFRATK